MDPSFRAHKIKLPLKKTILLQFYVQNNNYFVLETILKTVVNWKSHIALPSIILMHTSSTKPHFAPGIRLIREPNKSNFQVRETFQNASF